MAEIKKRLNIEGEKVIGIGYRSFLLAKAIKVGLPKLILKRMEMEKKCLLYL